MDIGNKTYSRQSGFPKRTRTRRIVQKANDNGISCDNFNAKEIEPCNIFPCPLNGQWRQWSNFGPCSVSCGNGTQVRTRTCKGPFYGGQNCPQDEPGEETIACTGTSEFCQSCTFGPWSDWSNCSKNCGLGGTKKRSRIIKGPECPGDTVQTEPCFETLCSNEFYVLDYIRIRLSEDLHAGSDNSWRVRFWTNYEKGSQLCKTNWLDRAGKRNESIS